MNACTTPGCKDPDCASLGGGPCSTVRPKLKWEYGIEHRPGMFIPVDGGTFTRLLRDRSPAMLESCNACYMKWLRAASATGQMTRCRGCNYRSHPFDTYRPL